MNSARRKLLLDAGAGFGWLALSTLLLHNETRGAASDRTRNPGPHFAAEVKRVVQVFCVGGMSHVDTFDYKPELSRRSGQPFDMPTFFGQAGNLMGQLSSTSNSAGRAVSGSATCYLNWRNVPTS